MRNVCSGFSDQAATGPLPLTAEEQAADVRIDQQILGAARERDLARDQDQDQDQDQDVTDIGEP